MKDPTTRSNRHPDSGGYRLILFGGPELFREEKPFPLSPLQRTFLGILYGGGKDGLDREEVLGLLWPDDPSPKARRRLNQLLYSIKRKTGSEGLFESLGERLRKIPSAVSTDLDSFEVALREERLKDCSETLIRGFLRRSMGQTSRPLTSWIESRERDLRGELARRLRDVFSEREERADWEGTREAAEAILLLNPLDEGALRTVMKARARAADPTEAEAAFVEFASRREEILGSPWKPSRETLLLLDRIRTNGEFNVHAGQEKERPAQPEPRLVGRDAEHARLQRTLESPPSELLRGVLVTGEAGIGKTRLIRESVFNLHLSGQLVFSADQAELEQLIPLNPLIEALNDSRVGAALSTLDDPWRAVLYGVMPSHFPGEGPIPQAPQIQAGSVPRRLFEAFHQLLRRLVDDAPLILVFENLQWADETTLSILEFLIKRWDRGGLQAVFSLRSEEIRKASPLQTFLQSLRVHEDFLELPLGDLDDADSEALIRDISGRPLNGGELRHLHSLAGGNPFFLIELTLEYLAGRVDEPYRPPEVLSIPLSIRQVLDRRLSQLSTGAEKALGALSVHSRGLRVEGLAEVAGLPVSQCLSGLDQLHEFRLVRSEGAEVFVSHELIRQTVYQGMASSTRAWLHLGVARHLRESSSSPPPDELAVHYHFAGAEKEALLYSREAAERAEGSGAIPEALRFLGIAREHTNAPRDVAEIIGRMGHLNYLHQNLEEAAPLLESAAGRYRQQKRDAEALEAELERVDSLGQTGLLPFPDCLEELERIKTEAKERGLWETFMKALDVEAHKKDLSADLEGVRKILKQAKEYSKAGGAKAYCKAQTLIALNIYFGGPDEGLRAARRAVRIAHSAADEDLLLQALNRLIIVLHYQGMLNLPEGQRTLREAETRLGTCGDLILKFFIRSNSAVWLLETGELARAARGFETVEGVLTGTKASKAHAMLNLNLGEMYLGSLDICEAREHYAEAKRHFSPSSPPYFETMADAGLGLCALHDGDLKEARALEAKLPSDPEFWTFDPTLLTIFRARMMIRRGNIVGALSHLAHVRRQVSERFRTAWLRLILEEARIQKRSTHEVNLRETREAVDFCERLGLASRREEFLRLGFS